MKITDDIIDAINARWRNLHIEGWDDDEAREIINGALQPLRDAMVHADSELSAICHGRPPSSKDELEALYHDIRRLYSGPRR